MTVEPLELSFEVACSAEHAFETFTAQTALWWPVNHTVSGERDVEIVFEPHGGGRIFERTGSGEEHDWGEIVVWEPPRRLAYRWYLGSGRNEPTDVTLDFIEVAADRTRIRIDHRGWERFGESAQDRRNGNDRGWNAVMPLFISAIERERQSLS